MLIQSLNKEARIVLSDIHSLAVLLVLPIVFMVIMTVAMSEKEANVLKNTAIFVAGGGNGEAPTIYKTYIEQQGFTIANQPDKAVVTITLDESFSERVLTGLENNAITVVFATQLTPQKKRLVVEHIKLAFSKLKLHLYMKDTGDVDESASMGEQVKIISEATGVDHIFDIKGGHKSQQSTILYSVPAWIIFGVYFIVLPVSMTTISEKQSGALIRLKTFPISVNQFFATKLTAFYVISLIQFCLLFVVGIFLVPQITQQPTLAVNQWSDILFTMLVVCLSACCLAFLIGSLINSFEQAIVFGGGINIILAALSGFMVPIDVMPAFMSKVASVSPLYWAAELIRHCLNGEGQPIFIQYIGQLIVFSLFSFVLALLMFKRKIRNLTWN